MKIFMKGIICCVVLCINVVGAIRIAAAQHCAISIAPNHVAAAKLRFKNFLQNFGDESQFWWFWDFGIDFKILKKVCNTCSPILGPILENFDFRILVKSQSYDKPPWRNFDFWSNFVENENFGFLGLRISNFVISSNFGF